MFARLCCAAVCALAGTFAFPNPALAGPIYANFQNNQLATINPANGAATVIGSTTAQLGDIAVSPTGQLFGVALNNGQLYSINTTDASLTAIGAAGGSLNALAFGPDGTLYAATGDDLFTVNTTTGARTTLNNTLGGTSAGDLVYADNGELLLSATNGNLIRINPTTGAVLGTVATGNNAIFGLATNNGTLFAFIGNDVFTLNPTTGALASVGDTGVNSDVFGAASAPTTIPEPATLAVLGFGLFGLGAYARRQKLAAVKA